MRNKTIFLFASVLLMAAVTGSPALAGERPDGDDPAVPPMQAASRESDVLATRAFVARVPANRMTRREVRLADITARAVRLRFTIGGTNEPPGPPTTRPKGQELVTVHLRAAVPPTPTR